MASFPRPLLASAWASTSAAASTSRCMPPVTLAPPACRRTFTSTPSLRVSQQRQREIRAMAAEAKNEADREKAIRMRNLTQYLAHEQSRMQIDQEPINVMLYANFRPFRDARHEPGFKLFPFLQAWASLATQTHNAKLIEYGEPARDVADIQNALFPLLFGELKVRLGRGPLVEHERNFLANFENVFTRFKQAELKGNANLLGAVSEPPIKEEQARQFKLKPRSPRVAQGVWKMQHARKPRIVSLIRVPMLGDCTISHCLVRFDIVEHITIPPKTPSEPPLVRSSPSVQNVLFERRDWLARALLQKGTLTAPGELLKKAPWKVKALVDYDDLNDGLEFQKRLTRREMAGYGKD